METQEILGRYTLTQSDDVFKLGGDTLALSRFTTVKQRARVCDLGCGTLALGLLLLEREATLTLTGIERDPAAAELARRNLRENGLTGTVLTGDLRDEALLPAGAFDLAVSNPPWFPTAGGRSGGPTRSEEQCTLEALCTAAARILKNGGRFALVHRPERLADLLAALRGSGLEPKRLQFVQHSPEKAPSAVLLEAARQGKPGLEVLPAEMVHDSH